MVEENSISSFKKHSKVLIILQVVLIALLVILGLNRGLDLGVPNFSIEKLFMVSLVLTTLFGLFVLIYVLVGLFRYDIANTSFIKRVNYKALMTLIFIAMIIGAVILFVNLVQVGGNIEELTWGSLIFGLIGFTILGIASFFVIFLIIDEVRLVI